MSKLVGPLIIFIRLLLLHLASCQHMGGMRGGIGGMRGGMGGMRGGMGMGGRGGLGANMNNLKLPPGFAYLRGEVVDVRNKVIQRVNQRGTNYYSFDSQDGPPVFQRFEKEGGRQFILFPDLNYPIGDGHFIVLRRMFGAMMPGAIPQPIYEAFQMSLGDSISGLVMNFDKEKYMQNRQNTMMGVGGYGGHTGSNIRGSSGGYHNSGSYPRMKRKDSFSGEVAEVQLSPMTDFSNLTLSQPKTVVNDIQDKQNSGKKINPN